jgi:integrase/recombinase XerD
MIGSFELHLRALNRSPKTLSVYLGAARRLAAWLAENSDLDGWDGVTRQHLQGWIVSLLGSSSSGNANNQYRAIQQFFKWMTKVEEEYAVSPMLGMEPPTIEEKLVPVIPDDVMAALLGTCKGKDFVQRRDLAILRLFRATGLRLAELGGMPTEAVRLKTRAADVFYVTAKGRRERTVKYDVGTAVALDRYMRARARVKHAGMPWLWLAERNRGRLTDSGIYQMVERRGNMVGQNLNPHMFRHTWAHVYRLKGGEVGDLMEMAGWRSDAMARRYGRSAAGERAMTAYDRVDVMGGL